MNSSADILANNSADILGFASGVVGFGREPGGRVTRATRDFVAGAGGFTLRCDGRVTRLHRDFVAGAGGGHL